MFLCFCAPQELYDRSVQLEAAASGEKRRLFNWIRER